MEFSGATSMFFGSMLLGLSVAAPIGPINIEIIRRGLTQNSRAAFAMGCGAVTADCTYLTLSLMGAGWISAASGSNAWRIIGLSMGAAMLVWLGVNAIRKAGRITTAGGADARQLNDAGRQMDKESPLKIYGVGLVLTLANPMTIALWLSIAAGFAASAEDTGRPLIRIAGVLSGALSWVCFVTAMTAGARRWINPAFLRLINILSGVILIVYGFRFAVRVFLR